MKMLVTIQNSTIENLNVSDCCKDALGSNQLSAASIDETPEQLLALKDKVDSPDDIDSASDKLGIGARLMNYHLATPANLKNYGIEGFEESIHVPVQISDREGGRSSLYYLEKGQTALAGVFFNNNGMLLRYFTRETGETKKAKTGDVYRLDLKSRNGEILYSGKGTLEVIDPDKGYGKVVFSDTEKDAKTEVWILWSCIRIRHEQKEKS